MNDEDFTARLTARVEQCRRLARSIADRHASEALTHMADEGEADIARLMNQPSKNSGSQPLDALNEATG